MPFLCTIGFILNKLQPRSNKPISTRFETLPDLFKLTVEELALAKKNAVPFTVDLQYLEEQYINKTIRIFKDKKLTDEVRSVLVTAYTSLQLIHAIYNSELEHKQYIDKLNTVEFLTTKDFTTLFGYKEDKQKALRSKINDPLPYTQAGGSGFAIIYERTIVKKWLENYEVK